jgi:hypothetical protein
MKMSRHESAGTSFPVTQRQVSEKLRTHQHGYESLLFTIAI